LKILLADDDATSLLIARRALQQLGHECHAVTDGDAAWAFYQSERPDIVISDWMMPGLTGLELCRNIRADPVGTYTYLILVTSKQAPAHILEGMNAGADDYLIKPLNPDDLHVRLIAAERVTALHRQLAHNRADLEALNRDLVRLAHRDPLTGLGNRLALREDLDSMEAKVQRYGLLYSLVILDVDHFKSYNDTYGHQAGDEVLHTVGDHLQRQCRTGDAIYRYGGEEFLCILPEQSLGAGIVAAERMRHSLERVAIPHADNPAGVVTLSAGVANLARDHARSASLVLKEADQALYRAKQLGRNRVEPLRHLQSA
jgi:two-component system, cell cycle response regulator